MRARGPHNTKAGCPDTSADVSLGDDSRLIRQATTMGLVPGIAASLALPNLLGTRAEGVPLASNVSVDTSGARVTYVIGLTTTTPAGSYGPGQVDVLNFTPVKSSDESGTEMFPLLIIVSVGQMCEGAILLLISNAGITLDADRCEGSRERWFLPIEL